MSEPLQDHELLGIETRLEMRERYVDVGGDYERNGEDDLLVLAASNDDQRDLLAEVKRLRSQVERLVMENGVDAVRYQRARKRADAYGRRGPCVALESAVAQTCKAWIAACDRLELAIKQRAKP